MPVGFHPVGRHRRNPFDLPPSRSVWRGAFTLGPLRQVSWLTVHRISRMRLRARHLPSTFVFNNASGYRRERSPIHSGATAADSHRFPSSSEQTPFGELLETDGGVCSVFRATIFL